MTGPCRRSELGHGVPHLFSILFGATLTEEKVYCLGGAAL